MSVFSKFYNYWRKFNLNVENKELLFNASISFTVRVVAAFSTLLMNLLVARKLGSSFSGIFFLCFAVITVLSTLVRMGGDNLIIKYVGIYSVEKKWKAVKLIVGKLIKVTVIFSAAVTVVLIPFHSQIARDVFHKADLNGTLFWMLLSMPLLALCNFFSYVFLGLKKVIWSVLVQTILVPLTVSVLIFILNPHDPVEVAKLYFGSSILTLAIAFYLWYKNVPNAGEAEKPVLPDHFWKSNYALWIFVVFQMAMQWGGQFIAGIYCSQSDLARLAVAQRTSMLISFILIAINLITSPHFASLHKQGKSENLKRYAINSTRLMVAFATPAVLVMVLFPKFIMSFFGAGFGAGASMLIVLSLGQYINVLTGSVTQLLMMCGHEKDTRNIQFFVGITCIILNFVLIKAFGVFGAALATALSVSLQNLIFVGMVKKRLGFNTLAIWTR